MTRPRHSLSVQIAALNEAVGTCRPDIREALEDARFTIQRVKDQRHILAMLADLKAKGINIRSRLWDFADERYFGKS